MLRLQMEPCLRRQRDAANGDPPGRDHARFSPRADSPDDGVASAVPDCSAEVVLEWR